MSDARAFAITQRTSFVFVALGIRTDVARQLLVVYSVLSSRNYGLYLRWLPNKEILHHGLCSAIVGVVHRYRIYQLKVKAEI